MIRAHPTSAQCLPFPRSGILDRARLLDTGVMRASVPSRGTRRAAGGEVRKKPEPVRKGLVRLSWNGGFPLCRHRCFQGGGTYTAVYMPIFYGTSRIMSSSPHGAAVFCFCVQNIWPLTYLESSCQSASFSRSFGVTSWW